MIQTLLVFLLPLQDATPPGVQGTPIIYLSRDTVNESRDHRVPLFAVYLAL